MQQAVELQAKREEIRVEYEEYQRRKRDELANAAKEDREFVQRVLAAEQADDAQKAEKHKGNKEDIQNYLAYLEALKMKEAENEKELEKLRQEQLEAAWSKREIKWKREELARQQLLANVVDGRSDQIAYKKNIMSKGAEHDRITTEKLVSDFKAFKLEEKEKNEERLKYNKEIQEFLNKQIKEKEKERADGHSEFMAFDVNAEKTA